MALKLKLVEWGHEMAQDASARVGWLDLPRHTWMAIALRAAGHTAFASLVSVIGSSIFLEIFSAGIDGFGVTIAALAPIVLGAPMIILMSVRQQQLIVAYDRLAAIARRDSLTGSLNHGAFLADVSAHLKTGAGALLLVDADHFKRVNDTFGHAIGDKALCLIAAAVTANAGGGALVGRMGGEEFGVFLPHGDIVAASASASAIRASVEAITLQVGREACQLTVSIGGVAAPAGADFDTLFRLADTHLYGVKRSGRNNVHVATIGDRPFQPRPLPPPVERLSPYRFRRA